MYKVSRFDKKLCRFLHKKFDYLTDDCDIFSIWHFRPPTRWKAFRDFLTEGPLCRPEWFAVVYWLVLIISISGTIYSFLEFASLYCGQRRCVSQWRQRKYHVLSNSVLRKCRLVGALVMMNAWLLLVFAVVNVSPVHMTPWITINMFVLGFELIMWLIEVMVGATKLKLHTVLTFVLPTLNFIFVHCVRNVFRRALESNEADDLRLWKKAF